MIVKEVIGNLHKNPTTKLLDYVDMEWFETTKRVQRKKTRSGIDIAIKFLREGQLLRDGDILFENDEMIIAVNVLEADAIIMSPTSILEAGTICYEIGNKHIPLFIQENQVLLPFEMPIFRWLEASGYKPREIRTKLLNLLKSNVAPHGHGSLGSTIFTKILKMATSKNEP